MTSWKIRRYAAYYCTIQFRVVTTGQMGRAGRASIRRMRFFAPDRTVQAAGPEAAMRVLEVDPESRLPERRAVLSPFLDD